MAGSLRGDLPHHRLHDGGFQKDPSGKPAEKGGWYFMRKEIEENSPSRRDGIDLKKETYFRRSYCTFLQDLGIRLQVPQVTIATAVIFCHRFFLRQSHAKNDKRIIATVCMFLAGKVEETPRPLRDVIIVSYEIIHKKNPAAAQRIKQKEVYEQQKELILLGERVVLTTLDFDLNVFHPYKPLVDAIKRFNVAQNALAQVAWNFVNDGLRTSLCLQFKPHHIAAGAIFLAAKFLKVKLPSDGEKVWWQEFDVTPRQLEDVSNQMLELYEQTRVPPSQGSEIEGSTSCGPSHHTPSRSATGNTHAPASTKSNVKDKATKPGISKASSSTPVENSGSSPIQNRSGDNRSSERNNATDQHGLKKNQHVGTKPSQHHDRKGKWENPSEFGSGYLHQDRDGNVRKNEMKDEWNSEGTRHGQYLDHREGTVGPSQQEAVKKIDKDKVKAALEKQKRSHAEICKKSNSLDEDDLIEKEVEDGVEMAAGRKKNQQDACKSRSMSSDKPTFQTSLNLVETQDVRDGPYWRTTEKSSGKPDLDTFEEGELSELDDSSKGFQSRRSK